ncbi:MAG: DeoR/GlpR family DNA-binding transcription regulator [Sphaerochaetaceae bacterium]|nr:DeoR/GlpR family DNA-binding transcription regulator [Sphaerochaetaceae bacterium]
MNERQQNILAILEHDGFASVCDLASRLQVSEMTIRRDFQLFEEKALVRRVHGGAMIVNKCIQEPQFELRESSFIEEKQQVAKLAATLVREGTTIALDSGTTALELVKFLTDVEGLTIITSNIRVINFCLDYNNLQVIVPGGMLRPGEGSLVGNYTLDFLKNIHVDQFFMGVGGIDNKVGVTEYNAEDAAVKKILVENARQVIALADSTKFNKITFAKICDLDSLDIVVTNTKVPDNFRDVFQQHGINVIQP